MNHEDAQAVQNIVGLGAPPRGGHHHGGFRRHGGGRRHFGGSWRWGPEIVVLQEPRCTWNQSNASPDVVRILRSLPFTLAADGTRWRQAFVLGNWWAEHAAPEWHIGQGSIYYVCTFSVGFSGPKKTSATAVTQISAPYESQAEMSMPPTSSSRGDVVVRPPIDALYGFGSIDAGDYHISGSGVALRVQANASSKEIATLENGENVRAFGDTDVDSEHMIGPQGTAVANDGKSPGIEYSHVGTQTHGAGWVALQFLAKGAGTQVQPKPAPTPAQAPSATERMGIVSKVLLGGAIVATVATGAFLLGKAVTESRPRRLAHA